MKPVLLDVQFRATILYSMTLLDTASVERIKNGPAKGFLSAWLARPTASYDSPRLSGVVSDLVSENVLRRCGSHGQSPVYTRGVNFEEELARVFDLLYEDDAIDLTNGENGEIELTVDPKSIYIPIETLYECFSELGYFEMQKELFYSI